MAEKSLELLLALSVCVLLIDTLEVIERPLEKAVLEGPPSLVSSVELPVFEARMLPPESVVLELPSSVVRVELFGLVVVLV